MLDTSKPAADKTELPSGWGMKGEGNAINTAQAVNATIATNTGRGWTFRGGGDPQPGKSPGSAHLIWDTPALKQPLEPPHQECMGINRLWALMPTCLGKVPLHPGASGCVFSSWPACEDLTLLPLEPV